MPVRKPTRKALIARRTAYFETRAALMAALRSIRAAKKSLAKTGVIKRSVQPVAYPPHYPDVVCRTLPSKAVLLFPPRVPTYICRMFFPPRVPTDICWRPPKPIRVTRKDFATAFDAIELWIKYLLKVYDGIHQKRPAARKRTPRK